MVRHIVLWKLVPSPDMAERAAAIKENLEALKDKIDVIKGIAVGINANPSDDASDIALVSEFETMTDLGEYQNHPAHKAVATAYVRPYVEERRVCDYEF